MTQSTKFPSPESTKLDQPKRDYKLGVGTAAIVALVIAYSLGVASAPKPEVLMTEQEFSALYQEYKQSQLSGQAVSTSTAEMLNKGNIKVGTAFLTEVMLWAEVGTGNLKKQ